MTNRTKKMNAVLMASAAASFGFFNAAAAQTAVETQICSRGGDIRSIEVLQPGNVGEACDLRYTRDGGSTIRVPYHANSSSGFCAEKAVELTQSLMAAGFECVAGNAGDVVAAAAPEPAVEPAPPEQASSEPGNLPVQPAEASEAAAVAQEEPASGEPVYEIVPSASAVATPETVAQTVTAQPEPGPQDALAAPDAAAEQAAAPEAGEPTPTAAAEPEPAPDTQRQALSIPAAPEEAVAPSNGLEDAAPTSEAVRGPQTLTQATAPSLASSAARRSGSAAGRIVGAEPLDPAATAETVQATSEDRLAAPAAAEPVQQAALDSAPTPQPRNVQKLRPAPDIIRGVLNAQAAAWNDGDLEGFMAGYWKSPDLRFVSGTEVTTGWSQTMKRYKNEYGDGASLGILTFDDLDVEMVSDDVAVVVGEFKLTRGAATDNGKFSLVLKQFDGRWRIVHDHSVSNDVTQ